VALLTREARPVCKALLEEGDDVWVSHPSAVDDESEEENEEENDEGENVEGEDEDGEAKSLGSQIGNYF
jgi:hypothetical protein